MTRKVIVSACSILAFLVGTSASLDAKEIRTPEPEVAKKDPDFHVQGEYSGSLGDRKVGVQVVARGDGKFDFVLHPGGLPGEGGRHKERKWVKKVGATGFKSDWGTGSVADGKLTFEDDAGKRLGTLVRAERKSPTLGKKPPKGAVVLFDGTSADAFDGGKVTKDGILTEGFKTKQLFQSFHLHLEFRTPWEPKRGGQGRGNSGCYMQGRYEVQILDSMGEPGRMGEAGGIYSIAPPLLNMAYPPLRWQTYDVDFTAPKMVDGKKVLGRMTVHHNGVLVQDNVELVHPTTACLKEYRNTGLNPGPLYVQNHGNPVRFRNIWLVEKK